MLAGFIIHVYEGTAHQPGTFRSMIDGTVTEDWARTHHPAWYQEATIATKRHKKHKSNSDPFVLFVLFCGRKDLIMRVYLRLTLVVIVSLGSATS